MMPLISFMDENNLQYINWKAKMNEFINQETKGWNVYKSIHPNVLADIKGIPIPRNPDSMLSYRRQSSVGFLSRW